MLKLLRLIIVLIVGTYIIYLANRKKLVGKTTAQKWGKIGIYALEMALGIIVFVAIILGMAYFSK
jgi:maltodextrin utilization protein YvdJ